MTPAEAVRALETALDAKDVDAAVRAKNFRCEAADILRKRKEPGLQNDAELVRQLAERLEQSFRKELTATLPTMGKYTCATLGVATEGTDRAVVTTECEGPAGKSTQKLLVCKSGDGWHGAFPIE